MQFSIFTTNCSNLKFHNLMDLSNLWNDLNTDKEDNRSIPLIKHLINTKRVKILIYLESK